jgi:hypothetical protein
MHITDQRNSNNFHGYKKIDLIINSKFIGSQQTHRKKELHQIDLQEIIVLRIKRERKPSSYCLRTRRSTMNYSCIIGEAPMDMMNPSMMVSRLDLVVLELAAAGIVFCRLPEGFCDFRVFIEQRGGGGGHKTPRCARRPRHTVVGCAHLGGLPHRLFAL